MAASLPLLLALAACSPGDGDEQPAESTTTPTPSALFVLGDSLSDVGNAAAFLMSDLASGATGEILYVDGGFNTVVAGMG